MANNNHAELKGSVLGQQFAITTKDVLSLLMFVMLCLAGWFAWQSNEKRLDIMQSHHLKIFDLLLEQNKQRDAQTQQIFQWLQRTNYNINHSEETQIPLGLPLPSAPDPKPGP